MKAVKGFLREKNYLATLNTLSEFTEFENLLFSDFVGARLTGCRDVSIDFDEKLIRICYQMLLHEF